MEGLEKATSQPTLTPREGATVARTSAPAVNRQAGPNTPMNARSDPPQFRFKRTVRHTYTCSGVSPEPGAWMHHVSNGATFHVALPFRMSELSTIMRLSELTFKSPFNVTSRLGNQTSSLMIVSDAGRSLPALLSAPSLDNPLVSIGPSGGAWQYPRQALSPKHQFPHESATAQPDLPLRH